MSVPTACVIGWPIRHSRSPLIHRHWLAKLGIAGDYVAVPVEPAAVDAFLKNDLRSRYVGGNVTVPHKEVALSAVAEADAVAAALGAVNTLWFESDRLIGGNTDPHGFLANLDENAPGWSGAGKSAIVLGAGGAARAVIWALRERGFEPVIVVNRTADRAAALAARFGKAVRPAEWSGLGGWLARADLLVNATSLGMSGQPALAIDLSPMNDAAIVADLVYAPLETDLLRAARRRSLTAVDGLGMLLHQAAPGFERWFGRRPQVTRELRDLVIADLAGA